MDGCASRQTLGGRRSDHPRQPDPFVSQAPPAGTRRGLDSGARAGSRAGRDTSLAHLSVEPRSAFDAKAMTSEVVMAARCAHEASRWVGLQPSLALAPVPDAVLGTEHPTAPFAVEDRKVANREPEGSGLKAAVATLVDQQAISGFGISERIHSHRESIARSWVGHSAGCRIR